MIGLSIECAVDMGALFYCHVLIALSLYCYSLIYDRISPAVRDALMLAPLLLLSTYSVLIGYSINHLWVILCVASLLYAPYAFSIMRAMLLLFPDEIRNSCGGLAYNIGVSISSFLPMALSYFIGKYHMPGFSYFFFFVSLAALPVFLLLMRRLKFSLAAQLEPAL